MRELPAEHAQRPARGPRPGRGRPRDLVRRARDARQPATCRYVPSRLSLVPRLFAHRAAARRGAAAHLHAARRARCRWAPRSTCSRRRWRQLRRRGGLVVAQLNPRMPYTYGDAVLPLDDASTTRSRSTRRWPRRGTWRSTTRRGAIGEPGRRPGARRRDAADRDRRRARRHPPRADRPPGPAGLDARCSATACSPSTGPARSTRGPGHRVVRVRVAGALRVGATATRGCGCCAPRRPTTRR